MTAFVKECRREWERLGVPELLADEMAAELEADLAEAEAEGVAAAEIVGESDPRRFAATWASERGLVSEPAPQKRRRRIWPWIVLAVVLLVVLPTWLALLTLGSGHATSEQPVRVTPPRRFRVPNLVGLTTCKAVRTAHDAGVGAVAIVGQRHGSPCSLIVLEQKPAPGHPVGRDGRLAKVTLRIGRR